VMTWHDVHSAQIGPFNFSYFSLVCLVMVNVEVLVASATVFG